jgi:hypothetical protein
VVVVDASGRRQALDCETYEEACDLVERLDRDLVAGPSARIGTVLDRYLRYLKYKGNKPGVVRP